MAQRMVRDVLNAVGLGSAVVFVVEERGAAKASYGGEVLAGG